MQYLWRDIIFHRKNNLWIEKAGQKAAMQVIKKYVIALRIIN